MKPIRIDFAASEHKQAEAVNWRRDAPDVLRSDSGKSIRLPPGVSVSMARSKSPHQTPNFLVSGLKNFLFRPSPENAFSSCDTHCKDITVRGRVITNSNALCYNNIPLCKELL